MSMPIYSTMEYTYRGIKSDRNVSFVSSFKISIKYLHCFRVGISHKFLFCYFPKSSAVFFMRSAIFTPKGHLPSQPLHPMQALAVIPSAS